MKISFPLICLVAATKLTFATEMLTFSSTSGTFNPGDSFGFDVTLTFSGYDAVGLDYKFETTAALAPFLFITGFTYGPEFTFELQPPDLPQGFTELEPSGLFTHASDLGAIEEEIFDFAVPGSYLVGHVVFAISDLALPGTYTFQTTATNFYNTSGVADTEFNEHLISSPAIYTLTVTGSQTVPESGPGLVVGFVSVLGLLLVSRKSQRNVSMRVL